jgi:hypothetical protein
MMRILLSLLLILAGTGASALSAELSPQEFAYGIPIVTSNDAAAYRFAIPPDVYQKAVRPGLGDLQVFNGRGEPVPYALEQPVAPLSARPPGRPLPLVPLRDESPAALNAMRVTTASQVSAMSLQTRSSDSDATSYVLDGQGLDAPISAIQVHWPEGAADYAGKIRVEAGDTLGLWHTVVGAAPIANLHLNVAQLIEDRVEFPSCRAKFWRLSWGGKPPPFELVSATAEAAADREIIE